MLSCVRNRQWSMSRVLQKRWRAASFSALLLVACGGRGDLEAELFTAQDQAALEGIDPATSQEAPGPGTFDEEAFGAVDVCDGEDNDGDGRLDEDFASFSTSCGLPGACAGTLTVTCTDGAVTSSCTGSSAPSVEILDGVDNDCDGDVDECDDGDYWCCDDADDVLRFRVDSDAAEDPSCLPESENTESRCSLEQVFDVATWTAAFGCRVVAELEPGTYRQTEELVITSGDLTLEGMGQEPDGTVITTQADCKSACSSTEGPCENLCDAVSCSTGAKHRLIRAEASMARPLALTLRNLTLRGGNDQSLGSVAGAGGGLLVVGGELVGERVVIVDNRARGRGAGLAVEDSSYTRLSDSVVRHNVGEQVGCGLHGLGGGFTGFGGGAYFNDSHVIIERSAFVHNIASDGGGLAALGSGSLHVRNSTFSDNHAAGRGGAILTAVSTVLEFDTIAYNEAAHDTHTSDANKRGGGLAADAGAELWAFGNVFAGNRVVSGSDFERSPDVSISEEASVQAARWNLVSRSGVGAESFASPEDPLVGTTARSLSAKLELFRIEGRVRGTFPLSSVSSVEVLAHMPEALSPLRKAYPNDTDDGDLPTCPWFDQRGVERNSDGACDLGAVEVSAESTDG